MKIILWWVIFMSCYGFQILHMHIASVEKLPLTTTGSPLQIRCKTFLSVTFVIPRERDCHEVYGTLQQLAQPGVAHITSIALIICEVFLTLQQLAQPGVAHITVIALIKYEVSVTFQNLSQTSVAHTIIACTRWFKYDRDKL
jgi:hypothetical protein